MVAECWEAMEEPLVGAVRLAAQVVWREAMEAVVVEVGWVVATVVAVEVEAVEHLEEERVVPAEAVDSTAGEVGI